MEISDKNKTLYQAIYTSIVKHGKLRVFEEFGFFKYIIIRETDECN